MNLIANNNNPIYLILHRPKHSQGLFVKVFSDLEVLFLRYYFSSAFHLLSVIPFPKTNLSFSSSYFFVSFDSNSSSLVN